MALTRQDVQMQLEESAERLDKLSKDFLHVAEAASIEGLTALKNVRRQAEEGKTSYTTASEAAAGLAVAMQESLQALESGQTSFDLAVHQNECDGMIEALLAMRGQARRTGQALGRHLARLAQDEDNGVEEAEAAG